MNREKWKFKILYDAGCPICRAEVKWLKEKDKKGYLLMEDISAPSFDASMYGKSRDELMRSIHGTFPDGSILSGMDAVMALYSSVGLGWLWLPAKLSFVRPFYDAAYRIFARYRFRNAMKEKACEKGRCNMS